MTSTVSILLLAYNQRSLVRAAIESVLRQDSEPLEIIVSDDASADGTYDEIVAAVREYRGPHRVVARRNERNLGIGAHLNALVECSSGELLIVAAGDDISEPSRARELLSAWQTGGRRADLLASTLVAMDANGRLGEVIAVDDLARWRGVDDWITRRPLVIGAAHAWTRRVFERYGPLHADIAYEDQILTFRALCAGGAITLPQPLVRYRSGGTSARTRHPDAGARLQRIALQNHRHLAELRQLLADSAHTASPQLVVRALQPELDKQEYLRELLAARDWRALAQSALSASRPVPWPWRWRKLWSVGSARLRLPQGDTSTTNAAR